MIIPMKKITLVLLAREKSEALKALRHVGVLHPVASAVTSASIESLVERKTRIQRALSVLDEAVVVKKKTKAAAKADGAGSSVAVPIDLPAFGKVTAADAAAAAEAIVTTVLDFVEEKQTLLEARNRDRAELDRIAIWGDVDPAGLTELARHGLDFALVELSSKTRARLDDAVKFLATGKTGQRIRGVVLKENGALPASFPEDAAVIAPPSASTAELRDRTKRAETRMALIDGALAALGERQPTLQAAARSLDARIEYETIHLGMPYLTDPETADALTGLEGFVPAADLNLIAAAAKTHGWAFLADDPGPDDAVPVKVNNSALVRIVQPIFEFLGTVPNYREYDISAWFLLFFCFFFAMIFGDAGYGSIMFAAGAFLAVKNKRAGKAVPDAIRLILLLSGFTIFWGVLTLSWFGIRAEYLPGFLKLIDIDWLSNANPNSGDNVKIFCFILGTVQLVIAHLKNIKRDIGSLKFLAQAGQAMMLVGMLSLVFNLVISAVRFPLPAYALPLVGVGFALNFIFANYDNAHPFPIALVKSVVGSFSNIVSVFLGVVNVFADIVSYIRLWAVGLAGVAISQTVNDMVGPLFGKAAFFLVGVAILLLGHGINLVLSLLSVIVHGVRLNMLEFSGHLGMEWSGFSYDPFRERENHTDTSLKELP